MTSKEPTTSCIEPHFDAQVETLYDNADVIVFMFVYNFN